MKHIIKYSEKEINYLSKKDKQLSAIIEKRGMIERGVNPDLFSALVDSIIGQQISTKAHATISLRLFEGLKGDISPKSIAECSAEYLQGFGISFRKVDYIQSTANKILNKEFNIEALNEMTDQEVIDELVKLRGVGVWTAQMLMTFSMQRPNIISFGDLAIVRGLRMLYGHKEISKDLFEKYEKRYSPYATVASLYLWALASGEIEGYEDPADKIIKKK